MGVNADSRFPETQGHHEVCRLAPDPRKLQEFVNLVGHPSVVLILYSSTDFPNVSRLDPVEPGRKDEFLNPFFGKAGHFLSITGHLKEPEGGFPRHLILGPERNDTGDENLKRITPARHLRDGGFPELPHLFTEDTDNIVDAIIIHRRTTSDFIPAGLADGSWTMNTLFHSHIHRDLCKILKI